MKYTGKFKDLVTKREALIDGTLEPVNGTPDDNGWSVPTKWSYVDKEGVAWTIEGSINGSGTTPNAWIAVLANRGAPNVYTSDLRTAPDGDVLDPRTSVFFSGGENADGTPMTGSLLTIVERIDDFGLQWRTIGRKAASDGFPWWLLVVGYLAYKQSKKRKRRSRK